MPTASRALRPMCFSQLIILQRKKRLNLQVHKKQRGCWN